MYQAYVIQNFNDAPVNVILGDRFATIDSAYRAITTYEQNFGKCSRAVIEPAGNVIPTETQKKSLKDNILKLFK